MIFRTFLRWMRSIYFALFFFALVICLSIWFFGPFVEFMASIRARVIAISAVAALWIFLCLLIFFLRRRKAKKMTEEIAEAVDTSPEDDMLAEEMGELKGKFREAIAALRKSKNGRRHLSELPWYVLIGPPGAGKTTAIVNSGLQFPLAEKLGKAAIGGVGGTRNCDWWFTNDAVLIDTAGRYTTQESDQEADNAAWLGFLGLLKKYRKRQPINGAMVAISLSDLSLQDEMTQKAHALAVRRRLNELRERLGVRFPVYVLFTKADLIAGFTEFFDDLGKEEREQVWGFTLPLETSRSEQPAVAGFDQEFGRLMGQLNAQMLEKMQRETDPQRRALIAGFPAQVASVRRVARDFVTEIFQDNRFENRHMLRGVYMTSGTQEGTPIDRLMLGMAQTFGIGRQAIGSGQGTGRSYFLTRLLESVIFNEAGLVSADDKVERRYRWTRRVAIAATILVAIGTGALWVRSYLGNSELLDEAAAKVTEYQQLAATIPPSPVGDTDLPPVVDALNRLRDMPANPVLTDPDPDLRVRYGLYQGEVVGTQAAQTYRAALNQRLLPRLLLRLEEQMTADMNNPELLYEALKIYLMLGLQGPMNPDLVKEWMQTDWSIAYPGVTRQELRDDLTDHLDALLSQPMEEIALNGPLVDRVQGILTELPLAQRVYNGIINSSVATALPKWRVTEAGGPAVARVLVRSSGKALNDGIEGIYTYDGFNDVFLSEAVSVAERVRDESWVLGERGEQVQTEGALLQLSRDVLDLYYNDYIARYDGVLADLDIIPMESLSHAVEVTNVLSGPTSPIVNILTEISNETKLTEDREVVNTEALSQGASSVIGIETRTNLSIQSQIILEALTSAVGQNSGEPPRPPGYYVEERFRWLHELVKRPEGQPSQLDQLMGLLTQVYQELNKMAFSGVTSGEESGQAILQFQQAAGRVQTGPLERWSSQITTGSSGIAADGTRASINARWQSAVLPFCEQVVSNRYPFSRRAGADVGMADFAKLFGPNGLIDTFFTENLLKHVDTRSRPWTFKQVNNVDLGISQQVLEQMQNAAEIRDAFFAGAPNVAVSFQITPEALDPKAKSVALEIDGQQVVFAHRGGQPVPVAITWPGSVGLARITFDPPLKNGESTLGRDGPWAWYRLLDAAEVRRTNVSDRKRIIFNVGGRIAIFQMQSSSVLNPFALPALAKFSCPKSM